MSGNVQFLLCPYSYVDDVLVAVISAVRLEGTSQVIDTNPDRLVYPCDTVCGVPQLFVVEDFRLRQVEKVDVSLKQQIQ